MRHWFLHLYSLIFLSKLYTLFQVYKLSLTAGGPYLWDSLAIREMVYTSKIRYNFSFFTCEWFPFYKLQDFFFQFSSFKISLWVVDKPTNSLLKRGFFILFLFFMESWKKILFHTEIEIQQSQRRKEIIASHLKGFAEYKGERFLSKF